MMDSEKECKDVVTQLQAIRSAVDRTIGLLVASNLESCIRMELKKGNQPDNVIREAVDLLVKSR
ncbi:hypothetical protein skT53_32700 [Effusibacillus dendaii]|uniref:Cytoplasmic protein n=2 Tax=Effusibacillus dendaii TaxID=2743772 RepID=A0A7I8DDV9_9BACL|nr:hypothetical protein skT53_32700 [Effusibacillus dendaii]